LVSVLLTFISFLPYLILKQMISVDFVPNSTVSNLILNFILILPVGFNAVSLWKYKRLFFYQYLHRFQDS
ncbi:acyltransferase, partial [Leptospira biflexa]